MGFFLSILNIPSWRPKWAFSEANLKILGLFYYGSSVGNWLTL
jgi:hypothetical protein